MGNKVDLVEVLASALGEVRGLLDSMAQGPEWDRAQIVRGYVESAAGGVEALRAEVVQAQEKAEELAGSLEIAKGLLDQQTARATDAEAREMVLRGRVLELESAAAQAAAQAAPEAQG